MRRIELLATVAFVFAGSAAADIYFPPPGGGGTLQDGAGNLLSTLPQIYAGSAAYGMKCDGATDDTAALQAAVNAAPGKTLVLPAGNCLISASINFTSNTAYFVQGQGKAIAAALGATVLKWSGPAGTNGPMLYLKGVRNSYFRDFLIENGSSTNRLGTAIQSETVTGQSTTGNHYENIYINGVNGQIDFGFRFVAGTGGDANNDLNQFTDVYVSNFATAAWSFEHSQSKAHLFYGCHYSGLLAANSLNGVTTNLGAGNLGGSFSWFGGGGGGVAVDFRLGGSNDAILISGGNWESSAQFLTSPGASGAWSITIEGVRWADNLLSGNAVDFGQTGGLLNIFGSAFGAGGKALKISSSGRAAAIGNSIKSTVAIPFVCPAATPTCIWTFDNNANNNVPIADNIGFQGATITTTAIGAGCNSAGVAIGGAATQASFQLTCGSTSVSTFTITWPVTRLAKPTCNITPETAAAALGLVIGTNNTTTLTVNWTTSTASTVWDISCQGT